MKKLYRDINNKMIGGVLAGFASYFNAEVTLLRAAYTILTVSLFVGEVELFDINIGGALFLLYLILWLIMPKEIKGTAQGVHSYNSNENGGRLLGRFIAVACSLLLLMIGFGGILIGVGVIASLTNADYLHIEMFSNIGTDFLPYLNAASESTVFAVSFSFAYFIPFIWMIYAGILGIGNLNAPKWRPGLIMVIVWIAAVIILAGAAMGVIANTAGGVTV